MNSTAWKWTRTGEAKVERPIASWNEKPATMTIVMMIAPRRKKRSSPIEGADGRSAIVAIGCPPGTLPVRDFYARRIARANVRFGWKADISKLARGTLRVLWRGIIKGGANDEIAIATFCHSAAAAGVPGR